MLDLDADNAPKLAEAPPAIPRGYVAFKGYLSGETDDIHRLYLDNTYWYWLEVHKDAIAARIRAPQNEADARSVVWIHRDAKVTKCQVGRAHELEDDAWTDPGGGPNTGGRRRPY